jgi:ankyrin repeat protein
MSLQLHDLLTKKKSSSEEAILQDILDDPEALRRVDGGSNLPLHLECQHQCRSAIIMKCIELYPEALAIENKDGALPLHLLLWSSSSTIENVLMMIEKYPEALRIEGCQPYSNAKNHRYLPIDIECKNRCRSVILSRCIELYPQSLAEAREEAHLPLHLLLLHPRSSIEDALLMIEKFPEALKYKPKSFAVANSYLPIHLECKNRCRVAIISKFIELYPESLVEGKGHRKLLSLLLSNSLASVDVILLVICAYPDALKCKDELYLDLPLHQECRNQCRSAILSKCIELYPESLYVQNHYDTLPIHLLLSNNTASVEDTLMVIEKYPEALQHRNSSGNLPLHVECLHRCRSAIISKCVELYPESLSISNKKDCLALHLLLSNPASSVEDALMMIDKCPEAVQFLENSSIMYVIDKYLPIHLECKNRCRPAIISKCLELYPEALSISVGSGALPLHLLLQNSSCTTEVALMVIEAYPEALRCYERALYTGEKCLPIHIECKIQCRSAVISNCIELYPEALLIQTAIDDGDIPLTLALNKLFWNLCENIYEMRKSLLVLLSANPASFYHPPHDPLIDRHPMMQAPAFRRLILNLLPSCLSSAAHLQAYHDLNWQPRCSLLQLWLQIRLKSDQEEARSQQPLLNIPEPCHDLHVSKTDRSMRLLMMKMLKESSLLVAIDGRVDYSVNLGDGIGDLMLRFIMAYL